MAFFSPVVDQTEAVAYCNRRRNIPPVVYNPAKLRKTHRRRHSTGSNNRLIHPDISLIQGLSIPRPRPRPRPRPIQDSPMAPTVQTDSENCDQNSFLGK